jgi:hypothetical protein
MSSPAAVLRHGREPGSPGNLNCPTRFIKLYRQLQRQGEHYYSLPDFVSETPVALELKFDDRMQELLEYATHIDLQALHPTLPSLLLLTFGDEDSLAHMFGAIYHPLDRVLEAFDPSGPSPPAIKTLVLLGKLMDCTDIRWSSTYLLQEGARRDDLCVLYTFVLLLVRVFMPWKLWDTFLVQLRCIGLESRGYLLKKCYEQLLLKKSRPLDVCMALMQETNERYEELGGGNCLDVVGNIKPDRLFFRTTDDDELDQLIAHHVAEPHTVRWSPLKRLENVTMHRGGGRRR